VTAQRRILTVRLDSALSVFVAGKVGEGDSYKNISAYVRDLIRRDKERAEKAAFIRLEAELRHAYAAPGSSYGSLTAAEVRWRSL
jgi:Arc/MetJ-type ribon-helix-helix transcriptional regulator